MNKKLSLREQARIELDAAKAIADGAAAAKRDLTAAEIAKADEHLAKVKSLQDEMKSRERADDVMAKLASIGLALPGWNPDGGGTTRAQTATGFKAVAASRWGGLVHDRIMSATAHGGIKALVGGTIDVPSVVSAPVETAGRPMTLLELIPIHRFAGDGVGNVFSFLRQSARNLNAAAIPDGAAKPISGVTFTDVEDRFRVYATVTEPMPQRYLSDYRQLIQVLEKQLGEGVLEALEADILTGDGQQVDEVVTDGVVTVPGRDPFYGILETEGVLSEDFATDALTSLSNARYTVEDSGVTPNAWVMNSADYKAIERLRENGSTGPLMFRSGRSQIEAYLGDYPIVISALMPSGSALLGDFGQTELVVREDDHLASDASGELFRRNQVQFRHEGRYGFAVLQPSAFIEVALTDD